MRNPIDRLTAGLPNGLRVTIDWLVTILGAILIVLAIKQWIINPYRIPSSSMEPTLHCAVPGAGCLAKGGLFDGSDRVLACRICYDFSSPKRGDIVVFNTPPKAAVVCGTGGVYVKRLIGLPGDTWSEKDGYVYIDGKKLDEPYINPQLSRRLQLPGPEDPPGPLLHDGRQPQRLVRLAPLGNRAAQEPDREGRRDLLAAGAALGAGAPRVRLRRGSGRPSGRGPLFASSSSERFGPW